MASSDASGQKRPLLGPALFNADDDQFQSKRWLTILLGFGLLTLGIDYFKYPELYEPGTALFSDQAAMFQVAQGGFGTVLRPDFNYLHPMPRFLAALADFLGIREGEVGTFYQVIGSVLRGMMLGVITLNVFRIIIPTDALRWLAALILITIGDHHLRFVYNVGYLQIVFVALVAALAMAARGRQITTLLAAACALAVTKIMMAVTLPLQIGAAIRQQGAARWIAALMCVLVLVNVGVAFAIDQANPDLDNWLSDPSISWNDRITLGFALPGILLARLTGLESLLGAGTLLTAGAGYALAAIGLVFLVLQRRWSALLVYIGLLGLALAYSIVTAALVTRLLNWPSVVQSAAEHGQLIYHAFPVLALALILLVIGLDALVRFGTQPIAGDRQIVSAWFAAGAGALLFAAPWAHNMHEPRALFRTEASADMWGSAWRAMEHPEGRQFCVPTPYTFHAPLPRGTCELLYRAPIQSRLIWSHHAGPDTPLVLDLSEVSPSARVMGIALNVRTVGAYDETVQFTITSNGQPIPGVGPIYREVYGSGRVIMVPFDTPLAGLRTIEIRAERPVLFLADQESGRDYFMVVGAP